jgi:hypothetical protein
MGKKGCVLRASVTMPNYEEDTEWNAVLRQKGIIPPKQKEVEITQESIENMMDQVITSKMQGKQHEDRTLEELDDLLQCDELLEDDRILE